MPRFPVGNFGEAGMNRSLELLVQLAARETDVSVLKRFDDVVEAMRRWERATRSYAQQATRIGELEAELIDAKIAARVSGLLEDGARNGDAIGTLEDHAEGVLRPSEFGTMLEQRLKELEEEIAGRKLTAQAKAMLRSAHGMSE